MWLPLENKVLRNLENSRFLLRHEMKDIIQLSLCHLTAKYFVSPNILLCEHSVVKFKLNFNKKISVNITGSNCMKKQRKAINIGVKIDVFGSFEKKVNISLILIPCFTGIECCYNFLKFICF